ncbi:uncharacterized conserved protein [Moesziomyces antarcticus T-34]|uniref:Uncharacterized conserved protein n=1 Tax=Pseudozyma antarctica (strain T-34) TaxID=1151754 RepID=M9ME66_PSEA3|nr:uncharacterized conserved protein [Moesziomyces antarcticus T-34]
MVTSTGVPSGWTHPFLALSHFPVPAPFVAPTHPPKEKRAGGLLAGWPGESSTCASAAKARRNPKSGGSSALGLFFSGRAPRKSVWSKVRMYRSGAHRGPGVFPLGQKGGRDRADPPLLPGTSTPSPPSDRTASERQFTCTVIALLSFCYCLLTSVKSHFDFGRPVYQSDRQFCEPHLAHQQQASARGADAHMSSFKNIFRNSNKDSPSAASNSGDHKRTKSTSASQSGSSDQPTLESSFPRGAYAATNSSVPVSPLSTPVNLPAIDVTDVSSLSPPRPQSSADSDASTLRTAVPPAADAHPIQSSSVRWDPKGTVPASSSSRSMARPSSSSHSQWRSEPGGALSSTGGKASRRSSKVDKSDEGHGKSEPLNRHELMRRAMATAQDYHAEDHDDDDSGSVFEDDHDHLSNSHHSHGASHHAHNQHHPAHPHPNTSTPITSRLAPPPDAPSDRPGDGSLSIDAFGNGQPRVVSANSNGAHNVNLPRSSAFPTPATPSKETSSAAAPSQTLTASATMPTIVTPAPIRAELPRSDSLEEIINQGNVYAPNRPATEGLGIQNNGQRGPPQRASTLMDRPISPERNPVQGVSKSASSGALLRPSDVPSAMDGSPRRPSDAGSTSGHGPGSLLRLRKNSDSSTISKMSKGKKNGAASAGIAGALAASGIAGMGVGHAAALQQSQAALADADSTATKKKKDAKRASSVTGDDGVAHVSGFQGGIYRDPSTGTVIEKDQDGNQFHPPRPHRDRSTSSFMSYDGSVTSDRSSVSGLGAAAGFGAASAALLSSIGGVPGMPTPMLTPDGGHPIGVGGLVPPEAGGVGGGGDHIDGETTWPEDMGPQITGFAVASSKRNNEFHQLFPQVPEDDYLIEDYGCALVREILTQGRLYISENHLCFKANIFGWVTNVVLPFSEVISIEKRMTAFVIPNAIQIATLQSKHNFTSFLSRDATYDLIVNIWKLSHPGVPIAAADQADLTDEYSEIEDEADSSAAAAGAGGADAKQRDGDQGGKEGGDGGIVDRVMDGLGMVGDLVGGALEMVGLEDVSFKTLAFGVVILVLLVSNVYTWRRGSGALASSSRMVEHLDGMHAAKMNRGYLSHDGYYGPLSPRRGAGGEEGAPPVYERVFAPNVYITPPGGAATTPEAIAKTVADVLERMYEQNLERFTKGAREADADPAAVKRLLAETEAQLDRIERKLKALNQDAAQAGQAGTGKPKAEL